MKELDEQIQDIKKEIIEARSLTIKSTHAFNSLAEDIKAIANKQAQYERRLNINSGVAYVLIAGLLFVSLKLAADARVREVEAKASHLAAEKASLEEDIKTYSERSKTRTLTEEQAEKLTGLFRDKKFKSFLKLYDAVEFDTLSKAEKVLIADMRLEARAELANQAYRRGVSLLKKKQQSAALESLTYAESLQDDKLRLYKTYLATAKALAGLSRHTESVAYTERIVKEKFGRELMVEAYWVMGKSYMNLSELDEARSSLRRVLQIWPGSSAAADARKLLTIVNTRIANKRS